MGFCKARSSGATTLIKAQHLEEGSPLEDQSSNLEKMPENCVYAWDSGGGIPTLRWYGSRCTLIDEIPSDPAVPLISTIVMLIASAIFSIISYFLFRYVTQVSGLDQASTNTHVISQRLPAGA